MNEIPVVASKAAELRQVFDLAFAAPPPVLPETEDLLTVRVEGDPYAILLRDIAGVATGRRVVALPAVTPNLLGLAGIRSGIVPVFGLGSILGYGPASGSLRWMVLCGAEESIALAFSDFEGYLRLPKSSFYAGENLSATRQYVNQIASTAAGVHAVINIPLVVKTIQHGSGQNRLAKEQ